MLFGHIGTEVCFFAAGAVMHPSLANGFVKSKQTAFLLRCLVPLTYPNPYHAAWPKPTIPWNLVFLQSHLVAAFTPVNIALLLVFLSYCGLIYAYSIKTYQALQFQASVCFQVTLKGNKSNTKDAVGRAGCRHHSKAQIAVVFVCQAWCTPSQ